MSAAEELEATEPRRHRPGARKRTVALRQITKEQIRIGRLIYPVKEWERLREALGPCRVALRKNGWCPLISCRYNLDLDQNTETGSITLNFPDLEPDEIPQSCALEVADEEGSTLLTVGTEMNLTRERSRNIESIALEKIRESDQWRS